MDLSIFLAALSGGIVRGLVGFLKHQLSYKSVPFNLKYFLGTILISGLIGATSALAIKELGLTLFGQFTLALAFVVGYAGGDFLENIYKIIVRRSNLGGE
jgi:hypothetical protein